MIGILAELLAHLQRDAEMRGPPGPSGPRGEEGSPGKLPLVKLWMAETVFYAGDVVAYDGGTYQAKRDTGQPPSHADWICLAAAGRDGNSITVRGTFDATADYRRLDVVALNGAVPAGNCWRAKASAGSLARGESAASADRRAIQD